ncbi:PREDICTED: cytochrome c oxidase assembly protein COX11, mitochondrial-like [Priapulus caudatus]|uniref:Cytochrome c oxidase assembly protein COX11, mitochondrial-like n=1 Tax=Priapulus caudatus TaxID=37621 RepID=A0ABM1EQP7_PRICU|nr:PREDICTED: cytochrome c oxidase assembly protein COX11, mitochondrial-like [Priapulus caudatus]
MMLSLACQASLAGGTRTGVYRHVCRSVRRHAAAMVTAATAAHPSANSAGSRDVLDASPRRPDAETPGRHRLRPCGLQMLSCFASHRGDRCTNFFVSLVAVPPLLSSLPSAMGARWLHVGASQRAAGGGSPRRRSHSYETSTTLMYASALLVLVGGISYAAVPMYRMFCQATGLGGQAGLLKSAADADKVETLKKVARSVLRIDGASSTRTAALEHALELQVRQQAQRKLHPGETALAFYTATNPTDDPVTGISTYNVVPFEAGLYFNKIQCFCFEEQLLNPHEQVDMPVFF